MTVKPDIVVKVGGGALKGGALEDLPSLLKSGHRVVIVHGGGQQLTRMLDSLGIESKFHEGLRITDEETLEIAEMVFAGSVNKALARELNGLGIPAVGISGTDGSTLSVTPVPNLGRVGEVQDVNPALISSLWAGGFVPVLAPLGLGPEGAYNVNADSAAAALAIGLGAGYLFLLTDVDGLLAEGEPVRSLLPNECEEYISSGLAAGGMVPKLRAAAEAARRGSKAGILNGNNPGVLRAALADEEVGTLIYEGAATCRQ